MTLEISNTTPLPAKIYANEGIAQVLFFRGERGAGGLVQGQEGQVPGPARRHAAEALARVGRVANATLSLPAQAIFVGVGDSLLGAARSAAEAH